VEGLRRILLKGTWFFYFHFRRGKKVWLLEKGGLLRRRFYFLLKKFAPKFFLLLLLLRPSIGVRVFKRGYFLILGLNQKIGALKLAVKSLGFGEVVFF